MSASVSEMNEKRVRFGSQDDFQEPTDNSNDVSVEEEGDILLNSPLKATYGLGSTIKKLSPVSGASQTEEAKRAYDRLLQQAAMSMFSNEDGDDENAGIGKENTANTSRATPDFYKVAAVVATPNSHAMYRLASQQYDLSPPMPHGLAPPAASTREVDEPTTPISSSHRDFLAYRETHSATRSGDIHKQLQGLRQDFLRAQQGGASPPAVQEAEGGTAVEAEAEAEPDAEVDAFETDDTYSGVVTESSPAAVAILNAHLNSIGMGEDESAGPYTTYQPNHSPYNEENSINQKETPQLYDSANETAECDSLAENLLSIPQHAGRDFPPSDSLHMDNIEEEAAVAPAHIYPISNDHTRTQIEKRQQIAETLRVDKVAGVSGVSIQEGEQLLKQYSLFLMKIEDELPRLNSLIGCESDSAPTTTARAIELSTYSVDGLEASVLLKHEQLVTRGVFGLNG